MHKPSLLLILFLFIHTGRVFAQPPINDECSGAIAVPANSDNSCNSTLTATGVNATQSLTPCIGSSAQDVWYKFTATATSHRITLAPTTYCNLVLQLFTGTCGSLTPVTCSVPGDFGQPMVELFTNLTIGNIYYFRVYDRFGNTPSLNFTICINSASTYIDNDDCSNATTIVPSPGTTCSFESFFNTGATQSAPAACTGSNEDDIWFKFTATNSRHQVWVTTTLSIFPVIEVFMGSCGSLVSIGCYSNSNGGSDTQNSPDINSLVPGNIYYFRVYGLAPNNSRGPLQVCIKTLPPGPPNDECSGAISVPVNNGNGCGSVLTATGVNASQSLTPCAGSIAQDVWYKFIATATTHRITLTPTTYCNLVLQFFSGTCDNLTSVSCTIPGDLGQPLVELFTNLTIGSTYYFRVYDRYGNTPNLNFTICINSASTYIDNDDCGNAAIIVPSSGTGCNFQSFFNNGATQSAPPTCIGSNEDDIWFKFIATNNRHQIWVTTTLPIFPVMQVFSGSCGSLVSMGCYNNSNGGTDMQNSPDISSFIPGNTYYFRVYGQASNNARGPLQICIKTIEATSPCPGGMAAFASNIAGSTYQWQVNAGSGFSNISPGEYPYSGENTSVLSIINAPTGMYGYQYRCLVNGSSYSNTTSLKFSSYWNGSISNDWENPSNWSCGTLPDLNTDVFITNGQVLLNSNKSCRSLTVSQDVSLQVSNGFTLNVVH